MCHWRGSAEWPCCRGLSILLANRRKPLRFRSFCSLRSQQLWQDSVRNWPCSIWPMEFVRVGQVGVFRLTASESGWHYKMFCSAMSQHFLWFAVKILTACLSKWSQALLYLNLTKVSAKVSHPYAICVGLVIHTLLACDDGFPSSYQLLDVISIGITCSPLFIFYRSLRYKTLNSSIIHCSCCIVWPFPPLE